MKNVNLPKIMLGTWSWGAGMYGGDQVFGNSISAQDVKGVFKAAIENGLNAFDTATAYGLGASEEILGELMADYKREDLVISTKFTPQLAEMYDNSVEKMAEASMARFHTDYIDIYWIHNPIESERWVAGLIPLLKAGKVKAVGVSNHNLAQIKRANEILNAEGFKINAVQNHFSLLYRSSEKAGILDYCKQNSITFFAYMTLEQGALSGKYSPETPMPASSGRGETYNKVLPQLVKLTDKMREIGERQRASVAQIAIAYAIVKGTLPILGVTKLHHISDVSKAINLVLTTDEVAELERLAEETGVDTKGAWEESMV